jgi:hypothetical protein
MDGIEEFRFSISPWTYVALLGGPLLFGILGTVSFLERQLNPAALVFLAPCIGWYVFIAVLLVMQYSTLILSPSGLERSLVGVRFKRLDWASVSTWP